MAAARAVIGAAGVPVPWRMFLALFRQEGLARGNRGRLSKEEESLCELWAEADQAAVSACCGTWRSPPQTCFLSMAEAVRQGEEQRRVWDGNSRDAGPHYDLTQAAPLELAL